MSSQDTTVQHEQPSATPAMSPTTNSNSEVTDVATSVGKEGLEEVAKEDETEHGQQQQDDVKAQAQGLWTKYCGCLSGP